MPETGAALRRARRERTTSYAWPNAAEPLTRPRQCIRRCSDRCTGCPGSPASCPPPGLAYTPRWRVLAPHRWGTRLPVQACWSLVRRRRRPPVRPRSRPRIPPARMSRRVGRCKVRHRHALSSLLTVPSGNLLNAASQLGMCRKRPSASRSFTRQTPSENCTKGT